MGVQVIKIEKGVPMPHASQWGFIKDIEIGDSFIVEEWQRHQIHNYTKRHGLKVQMSGIGLEKQMRVWRVE